VALLAADQESTEWSLVADTFAGFIVLAPGVFAGGERGEIGAVAFAGVVDCETLLAEDGEETLKLGDDGSDGGDIITLVLEITFW
jgi:hypothetical protein